MASEAMQKSYHGVAARIDRLPITGFHKKILWLLGGVTFCDSIDMNIGGPIIAQLLQSGWSDAAMNSLFVSITMVGYLFGGLLAGALSDGIGRKKSVVVCTTIFTIGCFAAAFSPDMQFLIACRFIMGLGLGAAFPAGYSALTEFTPPSKRGKYQSYVGLIGNTGVLAASFLNLIILPIAGWRPVFIFCGFLGLFVAIMCLLFLDESPRWLAMMGRNDDADKIMKRVEGKTAAKGLEVTQVTDEEIKAREEAEDVKQLPWSFLFGKKMITRTLTAMFLCFAMNVAVYTVATWTPTIFVMRGFDVGYSTMMTVVMQLGIPVAVGALTLYVEKVNRKTILIVTYVLIAVIGFAWSCIPADQTTLVMFCGYHRGHLPVRALPHRLPHPRRGRCQRLRSRCGHRVPDVDHLPAQHRARRCGRLRRQCRHRHLHGRLAGDLRRRDPWSYARGNHRRPARRGVRLQAHGSSRDLMHKSQASLRGLAFFFCLESAPRKRPARKTGKSALRKLINPQAGRASSEH